MAMVLTAEQRLLRDSVRTWAQDRAPVTHFRSLRDNGQTECADNWSSMIGQGWPGICIPEAQGGLGFGVQGMGLVLQELGRTLAASPLLSSCLLCSYLLEQLAIDDLAAEMLPTIAAGELRVALAIDEQPHHNPATTATTATAKGDGYQLNGQKTFVMDGIEAEKLLVLARSSGTTGDTAGLSLLLVDARAEGVTLEQLSTIDSRDWATISFNNAKAVLIGADGSAWEALDCALDRARSGLAAEMLGVCEELFERTLTYLKERQQFGVPIGSFQALKHRAAAMFCELELLKSVVLEALTAIDENRADTAALASLAKAKAGEVLHLISNEAVQMHGGMGVTDELDLGLFLKRARVLEQIYGNQQFHRERYASLASF